jgi:hypothetical protein
MYQSRMKDDELDDEHRADGMFAIRGGIFISTYSALATKHFYVSEICLPRYWHASKERVALPK